MKRCVTWSRFMPAHSAGPASALALSRAAWYAPPPLEWTVRDAGRDAALTGWSKAALNPRVLALGILQRERKTMELQVQLRLQGHGAQSAGTAPFFPSARARLYVPSAPDTVVG